MFCGFIFVPLKKRVRSDVALGFWLNYNCMFIYIHMQFFIYTCLYINLLYICVYKYDFSFYVLLHLYEYLFTYEKDPKSLFLKYDDGIQYQGTNFFKSYIELWENVKQKVYKYFTNSRLKKILFSASVYMCVLECFQIQELFKKKSLNCMLFPPNLTLSSFNLKNFLKRSYFQILKP